MKPRYQRIAYNGVYRSRFELNIAADLQSRGVRFDYESVTYPLVVEASAGHRCKVDADHDIVRLTRYTPDFQIEGGVLIVEAKGRFTGKDRKIALAFMRQYGKNYRMLFMRNNPLSKGSKTTYGEWCDKHGIPWAVGTSVPTEWLA